MHEVLNASEGKSTKDIIKTLGSELFLRNSTAVVDATTLEVVANVDDGSSAIERTVRVFSMPRTA